MKIKNTISVLALLLSFSAFATVHTVSNDPNNPAQYSGVQAAINAANPGDTIYVQATYVTLQNGTYQNAGTNYGNITINKRIVLIGSGYNPSQDIAYISTLGTVTFDTVNAVVGTSATGASGSVVSGFYINGNVNMQNYTTNVYATNLTLERCLISGSVNLYYSNNTIVQQNVFTTGAPLYLGSNTNLVVRNNIFNAPIYAFYNGVIVNFILTNNNFIGYVTTPNTAAYSLFPSYTPSNVVITNNIFFAVDPTGANNSTFNNNMTWVDANPTLPPGTTNVGSGNFSNTNPTFVNYPSTSQNYSTTYNFQLAAGSPGKNAGTDGTDIGVYGGIGFVASGAPNVPYIEHFVINNSSISVGQNLNSTIEAKAQK